MIFVAGPLVKYAAQVFEWGLTQDLCCSGCAAPAVKQHREQPATFVVLASQYGDMEVTRPADIALLLPGHS
jgi:hypothetical protein